MIAAALVAGFLCGSIPFGVIFAKLRGIDLRHVGSGNIGATNAARALGKGIGVIVLVCDAGKAALPLFALRRLYASEPRLDWMLAALGFGAVLGHMFSPWLRGRGGKGVATGLGIFLVLSPAAAAAGAVVWVALYAILRVSSIGSLVAIVAVPATIAVRHEPEATLVLSLALVPLIVWKHRDNIKRLLRHEEKTV